MWLTDFERAARDAEATNAREAGDRAWLSGAYDGDMSPAEARAEARPDVVRDMYRAAHEAYEAHLRAVERDALAALRETDLWREYTAATADFFGAGCSTPAEAARARAAIEAVRGYDYAAERELVAARVAHADTCWREVALRAAGRWLARLRGKYMLTVGRVFGRAA